jgi:hypothetical protein
MNIKLLIKKVRFILLIGAGFFSLELLSSNFYNNYMIYNKNKSCNYYLSPRNCRSCMVEIMNEVNKFDKIDTLFIIYPEGDFILRQNLLRIFKRHWKDKLIRDTVFGEFRGDLFDPNSTTQFRDSSLNSLFHYSTPLLFDRFNKQIRMIYK